MIINRILIVLTIILGLFFPSSTEASDQDPFFLDFEDAYIVCSPAKEVSGRISGPSMQVAAEHFVLSSGEDWDIKQLTSTLFHLQHKKWKDFFWRVDVGLKQVYKVIEGTFGSTEAEGTVINNIKVDENQYKNFLLRFSSFYLEYEPKSNKAKIVADGALIVDSDSMEVKQVEPNIYHMRHKRWGSFKFFWKADTLKREVYKVTDGGFGSSEGTEHLTKTYVRIGDEKTKTGATIPPTSKLEEPVFVHSHQFNSAEIVYVLPSEYMAYDSEPDMKFSGKITDRDFIFPLNNNWEVKRIGTDVYHFRNKGWKYFYWRVDAQKKKAYSVSRKIFGVSTDEGSVLEEIVVDISDDSKKISLRFLHAFFHFAARTNNIRIRVMAGGEILDVDNYFEIKQVAPSLHHVRYKTASKFCKRFDIKNKESTDISCEDFGIPEGIGEFENKEVYPGVLVDYGFVRFKESKRVKSEWIESQKVFFSDLLKHNMYDVLIVPFQVQAYAIDRIGRSLMTRHLADRIENTTDMRIPNITIVGRALGDGSRTFDIHEIYQLANDLKVRTLITGYVGHKRDEKMRLTLMIQIKDGNAPFSSDTKATTLIWQDIPFSDEQPPSEVFRNILDEVMSKLPFKQTRRFEVVEYKKTEQLPIPATIMSMVNTNPVSPIISAYYLQIIGMLFPEDTIEKEHLFERSLIALNKVSPESPDYTLLKARALFYLYRRPAALTTLGKPSTPEEKAFMALLNGNLPELKKWVDKIKSPFHKLIARIELNDLHWSYKQRSSKEMPKDIIGDLPDWEMILTRRLQHNDVWDIQSNLEVKQKMDEVFPIPDFTVKNITISSMILGGAFTEEDKIDLSVYNHYRRILSSQWERFCCLKDSKNPIEGDYLDLLYAISESNLLKSSSLNIYNQGLPDSALKKLDRYDIVYRGHPAMTYLRGSALSGKWLPKKNDYILKDRDELYFNAYYWSGGQVDFYYSNTFKYYDSDYPQRRFWAVNEGDREELKNEPLLERFISSISKIWHFKKVDYKKCKNLFIALKYTHNSFYPIKSFTQTYSGIHREEWKELKEVVLELIEKNKHRFIGDPKRAIFLAKFNKDSGNISEAIKAYEDVIVETPDNWAAYLELSNIYIKQGDFKNALSVFQRYPLLKEGQNEDRVEMSNYAIKAAVELWWHGAIDESIPLFNLAANSNTASGAEMAGSMILAYLNGNYTEAASHAQQLINRYDDKQGYREYITLLHLMGYHEESWAIFNTIDIRANLPDIWASAFIGHRMESKESEAIIQWLLQDSFSKVTSNYIGQYILMTHLTDRMPDQALPETIEKISKKFSKSDNRLRADEIQPEHAWFAEGYFHMRKGNFKQAGDIFKKRAESLNIHHSYAIPYYILSAVKAEQISEVEAFYKSLTEESDWDSFGVHLSKAYLHGIKGEHQTAIQHLKFASYRVPVTRSRPLFGWYQLVEACEWLYEDTGQEGYRKLALQWAKLHQRIRPMFAWAYAVEAKHTDSETDRLHALAITLYLDKQSERISKFSEKEKAEALEWLKENNLFLKIPEKLHKTGI